MSKRIINSPDQHAAHGIYSRVHEAGLIKLMKFELASLLGRMFLPGKPKLTSGKPNYLNLGCGRRYLPGCVNADHYAFWKPGQAYVSPPDWRLDLRYPLNCPDASFAGIFCQHVLEHLLPRQARDLLNELLRVLEPNGILRLVVPDLAKYVDYYQGKPSHEKFGRFATGCEALRSLTQNFGHKSLYDAKFLGSLLAQAGFADIAVCQPASGREPRLFGRDNLNKAWASLYMEARKPCQTAGESLKEP